MSESDSPEIIKAAEALVEQRRDDFGDTLPWDLLEPMEQEYYLAQARIVAAIVRPASDGKTAGPEGSAQREARSEHPVAGGGEEMESCPVCGALPCDQVELVRDRYKLPSPERMREALKFYADGRRYDGPNQINTRDDPHTDERMPYLTDVTRDGGRIARNALAARPAAAYAALTPSPRVEREARRQALLDAAREVDKILENGSPRETWSEIEKAVDDAREDALSAISALSLQVE